MEDNIEPQNELKDIKEMISRLCAANNHNVFFTVDFFVYNPKTGKVKDSFCAAYGERMALVDSLLHLTEIMRKEEDEDGFVNI